MVYRRLLGESRLSEFRFAKPVVLVATGAISGLLFVDLCDAIFGCGCFSLWSGAAEACNIHHAAPPHCPWCAHPGWGGAVAFFSVTVSQAVAVFWPATINLGVRIALALTAFPVVGGGVGLIQGLFIGYWS